MINCGMCELIYETLANPRFADEQRVHELCLVHIGSLACEDAQGLKRLLSLDCPVRILASMRRFKTNSTVQATGLRAIAAMSCKGVSCVQEFISFGAYDHVSRCLRMSNRDVHFYALVAMSSLANNDGGGAFTKSGACDIILKMLPSALPRLMMPMLDCMYALGRLMGQFKAAVMYILSRQYDDPKIHKRAVVVASLLGLNP